ncbi:MAG: RNA polymerase sigma factor [Planctomycetota bacterium]|jgi:RNA polymerase sigma factor (sigma-70 family)
MSTVPGPDPSCKRGETSDEDAARLWAIFLESTDPRSFDAFDRLYSAFFPTVVRYAALQLRDAHLAEDVANAVFVRLLETKPLLRSSFIGLLLRSARNACASEAARRSLRQAAPCEPEDSIEADPGRNLEQRDRDAALTDCLDRLSDPDRTLAVLHHGAGLTYRQIGDVLGQRVALSTFTRRLKRIKGQLLRCLKEKKIF